MLIFDDTYEWKGWGGRLRLGSGKCKLRIYDVSKGSSRGLAHLRPIFVIVSDLPEESTMTIRSCAGHIATSVTEEFDIDPNRMMWIEHYPQKEYGANNVRVIKERYDTVEFVWHDGKAIHPKWRPINPNMLETIKQLIE